MTFKVKLNFKERIGIVADISNLLADHKFNIISMDVIRTTIQAHVYMEIENRETPLEKEEILGFLGGIPGLKEIRCIDILPQEERTNRFRVVLDNMRDGVISIDREGCITTINKVACQVFNCRVNDMLGKAIQQLDLPEYAILQSLEGLTLDNVKQNIITPAGRRYQYISTCKPIRDSSDRIVGAVEIAKDMQEIKKLAQTLSEPGLTTFSDIIGDHPTIKEAIGFAQKIAATDVTIAIQGASGTGKELFARAIHTASNCQGPYIPINCAALPEHLLESELFGYLGGSFTGGKRKGKKGLFEKASQGTVFLDEIAEMPLGSQAKLLRLLQEKAVRPIGGDTEIPIHTRIITATNKNLVKLVEKNVFREDLYYRINVLPIHIPPLRQRITDIPILAEHFLFQLLIKLKKKMALLTPGALEKLAHHDWPGNVRELKNVIERAAFLSNGNTINEDNILFSHEMNHAVEQGALASSREKPIRPIREQVGELEKDIVQDTLKRLGTVRKAALALGISHPALLKKMKKYNIKLMQKVTTGNLS
ncbi:sigma-54 interaction domain-containing protein [Desulfocicer niacini]